MSLDFLDFRIRQRDHLLDIARAMVSRLSVRGVLRMILQASVDMLAGESGLIALSDDGGDFGFVASYGLPPALLDSFRPLVEDIPAVRRLEDFVMPDLAEKLVTVAEVTGLLLRQVVALPMIAEEQLLGMIFVFRSQSLRFSPDDRQILASFADYAAIAVNNARLYEAAETERRRLDALLDSSADGIMVLRPDLRIERFNRALATLAGWPAADAVGRHHDEVIQWSRLRSRVSLDDALAQGLLAAQGRTLYVEGELRRRNGSVVSLAITYAPLIARSGQLLNIIGTARDITRFREADTLKDTFISVVSHELKTPVAIIKGYSETLRRPEARRDPAMVEEMLGGITQEADRLAHLVDDLLDASRLQAGGLPFRDVDDVDLRDLAERVAERYRPRTKKHSLSLEFPADFPSVLGDAQRLEQVLDNLVSNAIKYSPRGGHVTISGRATPAEILLSVSDEGVGIPLDEQERIFDRFHRVEGPETRAVAGTGLGLYLTRAIVEAHGGRCWVVSTPGRGSTFYLALPRETSLAIWRDGSLV
ncbi:MAG: ATP-binding protein [Anaerolineae bacterium]|jgi:PAS domain S-box-containing protein|nr:ATP-binding protein [Anaerolineae bacterium]